MAYMLALMVGLGSFGLYVSAFFFPEVHRKYDLVWSGVGLFYALVLWVCAGRITGGVLLGQMSSVALLGWFSWQNLQLRRDRTPADQQTHLPESIQTPDEVVKFGAQTLKSLLKRTAQSAPVATPSTPAASASPAESTAPKTPRPGRSTPRPAPSGEPQPAIAADPKGATTPRSARRNLKKTAQPPAQPNPDPTPGSAKHRPETPPTLAGADAVPSPPSDLPTEPQDWDDGGEWETAELPLEEALGRFNPDVLNSLLEDTPSEPTPDDESAPIYLRAELLSEPTPASRNRRRSRRQRSTSARQLDISPPYSADEDLEEGAIASSEASSTTSGRSPVETRTPRRRRSTHATSDRGFSASASTTSRPDWSTDGAAVPPQQPTYTEASREPELKPSSLDQPDEAIAEDLTAPGQLDTPSTSAAQSADNDSEDWF